MAAAVGGVGPREVVRAALYGIVTAAADAFRPEALHGSGVPAASASNPRELYELGGMSAETSPATSVGAER